MTAARMAMVTTAHRWGDPRVFERELAACLEWGLETHVFMVLDGPLTRRGWSLDPGLVIHPLASGRGRLGRFLSALGVWREVLRHGPFPLVHFHDPELLPAMGLLGLLWPGTYTLFDIHEDLPLQVASKAYLPSWARGPVSRLCAWMLRLARGGFSGFAPATEAIAQAWPAARTRVVHNYPKSLFATEPGPLDPHRVLYVGALSPERGLLVVLEAMARAREAMPALRLDLVGRLEGGAVARAVREAQNQGWCRHVPWLEAAELARFARGAGIGLVLLQPRPSYLESLPTKLFEYMAMGIPILASDFPMWKDLVAGCGRQVPPEPGPVARALVEMAGEAGALERWSRAGREAYRDRFRWEVESVHLRWHLVRAGLLSPIPDEGDRPLAALPLRPPLAPQVEAPSPSRRPSCAS